MLKESEVAQSCPTLCDPMCYKSIRLLSPWNFPGKSTGVGCHFSAIKNNEIMPSAATWMDFAIIILKEEKDKCHILSFM